MQIFKKPNFNFMKYKIFAFSLSGIIITFGIINITKGKGLNQGIDFAGGSLVRLMLKTQVPIDEVRKSLSDAGLGSPRIQEIGNTKREYLIRTLQPAEIGKEEELEAHEIAGNKVVEALKQEEDRVALTKGLKDLNTIGEDELTLILQSFFPEEAVEIVKNILSFRISKGIIQDYDQLQQETGIRQEVVDKLKEKTFLGSLTVLSKESVGPQVGHDLRRKATQATIWALIGMLTYIGIRFKFAYGVAAIITLAHDVLITLSIFSFTNREINLPVIAAILTIVGYSLNDTIVIFDRVRDNIKTLRKHEFEGILDTSINQTLSRTVITSGTTFLTVMALYLFGGEVINDFAFTMIIGVLSGTYSSIYQSCSLLHFWNKIFKPKKGMGK
ncbi:MAG: protein translocase subunit SecF [Candidatus Aminicenantes bacterium]|nr:protein translocase subunit SecF [Candidatus Aminicenantes bacterium]MBL7084421.1 protein translocase subunit SecF [Candidatus Aminicenantes bacterium]